jgi:hypothetical protein
VDNRNGALKRTKPKSTAGASGFTTRLQKGGALLQDMRQMVCQWTTELDGEEAYRAANRMLHKSTLTRFKGY